MNRWNGVVNYATIRQAPRRSSEDVYPEAAVSAFHKRIDRGSAAKTRRLSHFDTAKRHSAVRLFEAKHAVVRPGPKQPCAVFIKTVHAVRIIPFSNRIDREQWFAAPRAGVGVETAHATAIGGDPVNTAASFQQMVNYRRRQSALHAVSDEAMAVETAQPAPGAEPEEAARVP